MMILICPACSTRYFLDPERLTEAGHRVRCTGCGEIWFQEPDFVSEQEFPESYIPDPLPLVEPPPQSFQKVMESIPDSVRPVLGPDLLPQARAAPRRAAWLWGGGVALALYALAFLGVVAMRDDLVMRWPPVVYVFDTLGIPFQLPGQNMTLEGLKAEMTGDKESGMRLSLSGRLINLKTVPISLVPLNVTALHAGDVEGERWIYRFPDDTLAAESEFPFGPSWPVAEGGIAAVRVQVDPLVREDLSAVTISE